ncbi:glycoside hydrolase family 3 N-terminal domain-containing protein [Gracilimonas sp.]|uniref:glycoside hydrolase family 3 N-terminal domain-containing protein n=1 Tax=Gracilimonas sp. TaxID=1974203 RepID=UPI0028719424|nr:glycoside hydrolase family 3 N-terminal domain-containing protein [Gracilimonas sp.]
MKPVFNVFFLLLSLSLLLTNPASAQNFPWSFSGEAENNISARSIDDEYEKYIDSLVAHTPLKEKIGQLFFVRAEGEFTPRYSQSFHELEKMVTDYHVGGLIFMQGEIYGQAVLNNKLQQMAKFPLWITQDMEFGAAMRISRTTRFTPAMGVAATGDKRNAFMMGKITAIEAKALGVHQIFAPVLDVNNNPENPVINVRSFSADPDIVGDFGTAFMQGVQSEQIIPTGKHFPGHGDTDVDSHLDFPIIDHNYSSLDSVELKPFRAAINKGMPSIMSAHIAFPKINNGQNLLATLDSLILGDVLQDSLKFNGMVVTDGLDMRGITSQFSPGQAVVRALKAGADIMLISPDTFTAINEVEAAVNNGELSEERINKSFAKLMVWKQIHGLFDSNNQIVLNDLDTKINTSFHQAEAARIARESISVLKNEDQILPIQAKEYPEVMMLAVSDDEDGRTGSTFARALRDYHPDVNYRVYDNRTSEKEKQEILREAAEADLVIIGSFIYLRFAQPIHLTGEKLAFLKQVLNRNNKSVLVSFGNPYIVSDLEEADVHIQGWANTNEQIDGVTAALFGASKVDAKLPIDIPNLYEIGDGLSFEHTALRYGSPEEVGLDPKELFKVDDIINDAIRDSVFPGAVVGIMKDGVLAYNRGYGYQDYTKTEAVQPTDVYDLASITKVMATTASTMKLIDEGKLSLDDRIAYFFPEFDTDEKRKITIRDILLHQSGLPPFRVYVDSIRTRPEIINAIKNEPLTYETGTDYVYSDLGMILLGEIIHEVSGKPLDVYSRSEFYYPMGMYSTFFNPHSQSRWLVNRIPPTEIDTVYDRGLVHAKVHDERAYYMDGVAGHAGLFSSAADIAKFATMLLNEGVYGDQRYLDSETVELFTTKQSEHSGRGLGFDRRSAEGFTTAGSLSGSDTFGHLGFTGTSFWIDRKKNMAVILLTNRTFPNRSYGSRISRIRAEVADAAYSAIID